MCEQRTKKMREHRKEKKTKFSKIDDLSSCLVLFTIYFVIFLRISVKLELWTSLLLLVSQLLLASLRSTLLWPASVLRVADP